MCVFHLFLCCVFAMSFFLVLVNYCFSSFFVDLLISLFLYFSLSFFLISFCHSFFLSFFLSCFLVLSSFLLWFFISFSCFLSESANISNHLSYPIPSHPICLVYLPTYINILSYTLQENCLPSFSPVWEAISFTDASIESMDCSSHQLGITVAPSGEGPPNSWRHCHYGEQGAEKLLLARKKVSKRARDARRQHGEDLLEGGLMMEAAQLMQSCSWGWMLNGGSTWWAPTAWQVCAIH